jgi:PAS domain-containing protein
MSKVCKALAQFRPNMIAQIRTLGESDLILMERAFQRTVLELQKILPLTGAAHCVWRRTGEISFALREFCILTGWTANSLCSRSIHEILDEVTVVEYWERYAGCVTDSAEHYFCLTNGGILRPDGKCVRGSFWITVRKDIFDIPLAIVGCFIPNLWHCKT